MAFIKDDPATAARLVAGIQRLDQQHRAKGLKTFVVFMGGPELKEPLEKVAAERNISVPMTFLPQGANQQTIARYKINPQARNTIMVYNRQTIHATFVDVLDRDAFERVSQATAEMLGG